jgi:hypothetical protein
MEAPHFPSRRERKVGYPDGGFADLRLQIRFSESCPVGQVLHVT